MEESELRKNIYLNHHFFLIVFHNFSQFLLDIEMFLIHEFVFNIGYSVKLGNKDRFDKEQIGIKEPFPVTNLPFTS